jgi:hypothetical protein
LARKYRCLASGDSIFGRLSPAVFEKNFLKTSAELYRLLADELEALIESLENPLRHEYSCLKRPPLRPDLARLG